MREHICGSFVCTNKEAWGPNATRKDALGNQLSLSDVSLSRRRNDGPGPPFPTRRQFAVCLCFPKFASVQNCGAQEKCSEEICCPRPCSRRALASRGRRRPFPLLLQSSSSKSMTPWWSEADTTAWWRPLTCPRAASAASEC